MADKILKTYLVRVQFESDRRPHIEKIKAVDMEVKPNGTVVFIGADGDSVYVVAPENFFEAKISE